MCSPVRAGAKNKGSSRPDLELYYFDGRGRGETARLICAAGGLSYKDNRIEFAQWPDLKTKMPAGSVPVLQVDGIRYDQSSAICRYLAREAGLSGGNSLDVFAVDSIADFVTEVRDGAVTAFFTQDDTAKKNAAEKLKETQKRVFGHLESVLRRNRGGDGYFVGNKLTWADLHLYAATDIPLSGAEVLEEFPKLAGLRDRVGKLPRVAKYLEDRPNTDF